MSPRIGLTLQKIVETAAEIADANGIQEVTLASLAQTLGGTFTFAIQSCERFTRCTETSWYLRNQAAV